MMQELNYIRFGDYYIPDIRLPEETRPIGRWGRMHRDYIKEHKQVKKAVLTVETDLLKKLIGNIYVDQTIWNLGKYSLAEKVQISYQILGYEYLHGHFDKLYGACVNALLPIFEKIRSNIGNMKPRVFEIGNDDYDGQDQELLNLSNCLNITYTLLFFSLRSRSQLGAQVWQQAGVPLPSFLNPDKLSKQKRLEYWVRLTK